jgi:hypothetical protein
MTLETLNKLLKDMSSIISFDNLSHREILEFKETLELINNFKKDSNKYLYNILYSKYLKRLSEWDVLLSIEDREKSNIDSLLSSKYANDDLYFFCYVDKKFYHYEIRFGLTSMGRIEYNKYNLSFGDNNNLILDINATVYHSRSPSSFSDRGSLYVDINLDTGKINYKLDCKLSRMLFNNF